MELRALCVYCQYLNAFQLARSWYPRDPRVARSHESDEMNWNDFLLPCEYFPDMFDVCKADALALNWLMNDQNNLYIDMRMFIALFVSTQQPHCLADCVRCVCGPATEMTNLANGYTYCSA